MTEPSTIWSNDDDGENDIWEGHLISGATLIVVITPSKAIIVVGVNNRPKLERCRHLRHWNAELYLNIWAVSSSVCLRCLALEVYWHVEQYHVGYVIELAETLADNSQLEIHELQ